MCVTNHYFDGIFTIFRNSPTKYLLHVANNIVDAFKLLVDYGGILVPLTFPGVFEVLFSNQIRKWSVVLGVMAIYIFMVSQAFISEWYLLGWMPVVIILAVIFLENLFRRLNLQYLFFQKYHLRQVTLIVLVIGGLGLSYNRLSSSLTIRASNPGTVELDKVTNALKKDRSISVIKSYYGY